MYLVRRAELHSINNTGRTHIYIFSIRANMNRIKRLSGFRFTVLKILRDHIENEWILKITEAPLIDTSKILVHNP